MTIIIPNKNEENINLVTCAISELYPEGKIIISNDPESKGKGWALKQGITLAKDLPIVFIDGDNDIEPRMIKRLLPFIEDYDIVVGRKELPGSLKRKLITILSRAYVRLLFGIRQDTQTGLKIFNYRPEWVTNSWAFDIEILYKAKKMGKRIIEVPIHATVSDSKTSKDLWITFVDSLKIRYLR